MPRAKSHRRAQALKRRMGDNQWCGAKKPDPEFVSRAGTGSRHRVKRWPASKVTHRQVKLVTPTQHPDKKLVFVVGDSHLRALVDGFVTMPDGPVSFGFLSSPGAVAADLRTEVAHAVLPWTPDLVCVCAPSNNLPRPITDEESDNLPRPRPISEAAGDFGALLRTVCSLWPKVFVLDFPPRLNVAPVVQELYRQEFHRVAARMGVPYVSVAENLPLCELELWCHDGVHLSDTEGMPVLARVLWNAAVDQLFPPPPPPVPAASSSTSRRVRVSPPRLVVTGHRPVLRRKDPFKWTVVGREGGLGAIPVQQSVIAPNPMYFSAAMLDEMEKVAPSSDSDSDCTASPPAKKSCRGRRWPRRGGARSRGGKQQVLLTPSPAPLTVSAFTCVPAAPQAEVVVQASAEDYDTHWPPLSMSPAVQQVPATAQESASVESAEVFATVAVCAPSPRPSVQQATTQDSASAVPEMDVEGMAAVCPEALAEAQVPQKISQAKGASVPCLCAPDANVSASSDVSIKADDSIRLVKVVQGSFHQADAQFVYGGLQCMAISIVSLAKHTFNSVFSWNTPDLDHTLVAGDEVYSFLRDNNVIKHASHMLSVPELPKVLVLDEQIFECNFEDTVSGDVAVTEGELINLRVLSSLRDGLEQIFSKYSTCLLTLCANTCAIICEKGRFAVVDSHPRSNCGMLQHNGTSVVLHFACLNDLYHYICRLADNLGSEDKAFELCGVRVSVSANPAQSAGALEVCIPEMNTSPAPSSAGGTQVSAESCVCECGLGAVTTPPPADISAAACPSSSAAESTVSTGKACPISPAARSHSSELNTDVEFVSALTNGDLVFCPLGQSVCQALCTKLHCDYVKFNQSMSTAVGLLGVPCKNEAIVADGNCFFRAVSQAVSGSQKHHRKIRLAVCKEMERDANTYYSFLRSEYSSVVEYLEKSNMKRVNSWATEVEIQATADWLGIAVFTFHDGRWLKYGCRTEPLSTECIYIENVMGRHYENVVCVCKPGQQSCYGYCKVKEVTGYSIRPSTRVVTDSGRTGDSCHAAFIGSGKAEQAHDEGVKGTREGGKGRMSKFLRCKKKTQERLNRSLRIKRQERIRKLYQESMLFQEKAKAWSAANYCKNAPHRERVKKAIVHKYSLNTKYRTMMQARSIRKYRENTAHRDTVKAKSISKYRENANFRDTVKAKSISQYRENANLRDTVKAKSISKYRENANFRDTAKAKSISKYRENADFRDTAKAKSISKYRENANFRDTAKAKSISKYRENVNFRDTAKAKSMSKYRENANFRDTAKAKSMSKYRENVNFRDTAKAKSISKYRENAIFRDTAKAKSISKYRENANFRDTVNARSLVKYRTNRVYREARKQWSVYKYNSSLEHKNRVISRVKVNRAQLRENAKKWGFVMTQFFAKVRDGPDFVCCVCHRLLFRYQVLRCERESYCRSSGAASIAERCISVQYLHECNDMCVVPCSLASSRGQLWICHTCHQKLSRGEMPAECWVNNLELDPIPPELGCLNSLEQHLIALHIPFMKMLALPKGGQNGVHGPVTCVPANIVQTTNVLPRSSTEGSLLQVKLKRKLTYKGHYEFQFVDSLRIKQALQYLKRTNPLYRDIDFNEDWVNEFCREEEEKKENAEASSDAQGVEKPSQSCQDECQSTEHATGVEAAEDASDLIQDELLHDRQQHCMYQDTCLMPVDIGQEALDHYLDSVLNIAPAEGNSPVRLLSDHKNEAKCFPALFPEGKKTFHDGRPKSITLARYFNNRLMHADGRFAHNVEYIFFAQYMVELQKVLSSVSVALRKGKGSQRPQRISQDMLKDEETLKKLLEFDDGYRFLKPIRGTPAYWQGAQKDILALVRQLGIPTWFCSLSSADLRWQNLTISIMKLEGRLQTVEDLEWSEKCAMLRRNPVMAARMFDYRLHCFLKEVLMSLLEPIGKIIDHFYRIEFQQRGSPHAHLLFWIEGAPQIDKNTEEEVVAFIDKYVTCELPSDDDTLLDIVSSVQKHSKHHAKSCKKKNTVCRFNFPRPVSERTFICKTEEVKCDHKKTDEVNEAPDLKRKPACPSCENNYRMPLKDAQEILTAVKKAVESGVPHASVGDLFSSLNITQAVFEEAYRRVEKKTTVVYKRGLDEVWINQYNKQLLKCWNANMDISFVTDAYAVIVYILSYITKAEGEMGLLLSNAQKEAKQQGNVSAKDALKKLGSVYLHNRDVCAQEAVYRLTNMHLKECSRKVVFVPTGSNIVKMSLPMSVLRQKASSHDLRKEDMWMTSIVDRYVNRPDGGVFDDMCMATFASEYRVLSKGEHSPNKIALKNELGFILRRTRSQFAVIRYMRFKLDKQEEAHFQSLLQLFLPYRTDSDLKPEGFELFQQFYNDGMVTSSDGSVHLVCNVVDINRAQFEIDCPHLERAQDLAEQLNDVDDAWGALCPEKEVERLECLEENRQSQEAEIAEEQVVESVDNIPDLLGGNTPAARLERNNNLLCRSEGLALIRSLNATQMAVFNQVRQWCLQKVRGEDPEPLRVFVTGGAGTGKSHLIRAIQYEAGRLLATLCHQPDDLCVLLTAPTGIAAYNLNAATIHHTFSIGIQASLPYTPLGEDKLNSLRATLAHLQIIIIDEISMVHHNLLAYIHGRLRQIKKTGDYSSFGNVSVIAVGDFYQLPPVKGKPLYVSHVGADLWCNFSIVELKTVVRQKDSVFAELLNRLRVRSKDSPMSASDIQLLKARETGEESSALHIFPTNMQVSEHNLKQLFASCPDHVEIEARDYINNRRTGKLERMVSHHSSVDTSLPETLCLGTNARVMLCKNVDVEDGLVNGACGTVTEIIFGEDATFPLRVYVRFDDPKIGATQRKKRAHAGVDCRYSTAIVPEQENANKRGGLRQQFPLRLAWACTVHKVQGLTVDEAVVSLKKVFAPGQAYVALSRVRSLSGLIIRDFKENAIYCKDAIKEALNSMSPFLVEQPKPSVDAQSFSVYLMNVQSLSRHAVDLASCTQHLQPNCIAVTETWLTAQSSLDSVQIDGYTFHHRPRGLCYSSSDPKLSTLRDMEHGGVGMYSADNVDCEILQAPNVNLECLVCLCNKGDVLLAVIYRPPCYANSMFKQNLGKLLDWLSPRSNTIVVVGDFNENILKGSSICDFMNTKGFSQFVTQATTEKATLIDHVYVRTARFDVQCAVMSTYFSDHEGVLCSLTLKNDHRQLQDTATLSIDTVDVERVFSIDFD